MLSPDILPYPGWGPTPITELRRQSAEREYIWKGFLAPGKITSLTALPKCGKTTFVSHLLKAMDGSVTQFCGQPIRAAKVMLISEEHPDLWIERRDRLGLGPHLATFHQPFLVPPTVDEWILYLARLAVVVKQDYYELVVFDTMHNLWCVKKEEDAPQTIAALTPLRMLTQGDAAVLALFHSTKADTSEGRLTQGTGAIGGLVDNIMEMRRFDAEREADTRRDIKSYSRFEETPPEIVIELDKEAKTFNLVGTKADARAADRLETLLDLLPSDPPGLTVHEILERWPSFDARFPAEAAVAPRPAISSLRRDLETAKALGLVHVIGDGTKGTPFRYHT